MRFGPNHHQVAAFLDSVNQIQWFSCVGQPTDDDAKLIRIDLEFVLSKPRDHTDLWGDVLIRAEVRFERLILDNARLSEQVAIMKAAVPSYPDDFFVRLSRDFPDYYEDMRMYSDELIDTSSIERIVRGAASEIMVADIDPSLNFFRGLIPWFQRGHWPYGWEGQWPEGKLMLW